MLEAYLIVTPALALLVWLIWIDIDFHYEYTSQTGWKTLCDEHSEIQLKLGRYIITNDMIGDKYYKLRKSQICQLSVNTNDKCDTYRAYIYNDNVNIIGDFNKYSKITKIEYRPVDGMRKNFWGYRSPIKKPNVDIELRVTVDSVQHEKALRSLRSLLGD